MDECKHSGIKKIKLLVAILERGLGEDLAEILRESGVTFNMISPAYRASGSALMDCFGFSNPERDLVLSVVTEDKVDSIMKKIMYKFDLDEPGNGIAFTIPISGVSGPLALRYISGMSEG
ncbi:hypothetical protein [Sinanaerobacter chloroacetimidivorans]|nr:hypothetical protein [Sinanaerobacter chloroacetimidivorans]